MAELIPAMPGYWWLSAGYIKGKPLRFYESPVLAWRLVDGDMKPYVYFYPSEYDDEVAWGLDCALECPDGRCINDSGEVFANAAAWIDHVRTEWEPDGVFYDASATQEC